jgi:hypothetical protein
MRWTRAWIAGVCVTLTLGCTRDEPDLSLRLMTEDMSVRVLPDPVPPYAREPVKYKVVVRDRKTGQPIEGGQGRIFATSKDGANYWDALLPGQELGTYYGTMHFITSGDWALAIQFRRDSTKVLERVGDWMQQVFPARGEKK